MKQVSEQDGVIKQAIETDQFLQVGKQDAVIK